MDNILFYEGSKPDKTYFNNIDNNKYLFLYTLNLFFKDECISYLNKDLDSFYLVRHRANKVLL